MEFGYQVGRAVPRPGPAPDGRCRPEAPREGGPRRNPQPFDEEHTRLFTFALPLEHEFVALRAVVQGKGISIKRQVIAKGGTSPAAAAVGKQKAYMDGKGCTATVYDRAKLKAGNRIAGPAIVMEMDSTTVILPKHHGKVDTYGNILIYPTATRHRRRRRAGPGEGGCTGAQASGGRAARRAK